MRYRIEITDKARSDLRKIFEYIALELLIPATASAQLYRLEEAVMSLDIMPKRFRKYESEPWRSRGLRIMPVDNYAILYIPDEKTGIVTVLRIMYSGSDIENQLKNQ